MQWIRRAVCGLFNRSLARRRSQSQRAVSALEDRIVLAVSGAEQLYLELVNRARANPGAEAAQYSIDLNEGLAAGTLTNTPKQPLALNNLLHVAIQNHLQDMINNDFFSHTGSNGSTSVQRIQAAGYTGYITVGENLGFKATTQSPNLEQFVLENHRNLFVDAGIAGRGHRVNILRTAFKETGSGVRTGVYTSGGTNFNAVFVGNDFGAKAGNSFVTGVAYSDTVSANNFYNIGEGLAGLNVSLSGSEGTFNTTTNEAGGYQLAVPAGTYTVTFSGAGLAVPVSKSVTISTENKKVDINSRTDLPTLPTLTFQAATASVNEGAGTVTVRVNLSAAAASTVTVNYATSNGTATAGSDYTATSGTLTFAAGETFKTFTVPIINDAAFDAGETFNVALSSPTGATVGTPGTSVVTIVDNDLPGVSFTTATGSGAESTTSVTFTVVLQQASSQTVTVNYAVSGGTATAGADFNLAAGTLTFAPGTTTRTFTLAVINDTVDEPDQTVAVTLSGAVNASMGATPTRTYTILDNDFGPSTKLDFKTASGSSTTSVTVSEAGGFIDVPVLLSKASELPINVSVGALLTGTATAGVDFDMPSDTLSFAPGETRKTLRLNISEDLLDELNETIKLIISGGTNSTYSSTSATVTITDNDLAPTVSYVLPSSSGREEIASPAPIQVQLSEVSGQKVTVKYAISKTGTTASSKSDFTLKAGTLTFLPGETVKTIPLVLKNDTATEANETIRILLSSPTGATLGSLIAHVFTIIDDESNPLV